MGEVQTALLGVTSASASPWYRGKAPEHRRRRLHVGLALLQPPPALQRPMLPRTQEASVIQGRRMDVERQIPGIPSNEPCSSPCARAGCWA